MLNRSWEGNGPLADREKERGVSSTGFDRSVEGETSKLYRREDMKTRSGACERARVVQKTTGIERRERRVDRELGKVRARRMK